MAERREMADLFEDIRYHLNAAGHAPHPDTRISAITLTQQIVLTKLAESTHNDFGPAAARIFVSDYAGHYMGLDKQVVKQQVLPYFELGKPIPLFRRTMYQAGAIVNRLRQAGNNYIDKKVSSALF